MSAPASLVNGARAIAAGRVAFGVAMVARPQICRGWLGDAVDAPATQTVIRALGVRDLVLGGLALHTVTNPQFGGRMVMTCAAADATDLVATLVAAKGLPRNGVIGTVALAGGAAAAGIVVGRALQSANS